jgi:hypothetical protein
MKYLTPYKLFESNETNYDDIKETLREILLPISDMGYNVEVMDNVEDIFNLAKKVNQDYAYQVAKDTQLSSIIIRVVEFKFGNTPLKTNDEVKEEFNRMNDYLESIGFNVSARYIKVGKDLNNPPGTQLVLDFNEFIKNDFELIQLMFRAN